MSDTPRTDAKDAECARRLLLDGGLIIDAIDADFARQLERELAAAQAKIDALMLEYCPGEMTPEQVDQWGRNRARRQSRRGAAQMTALAAQVSRERPIIFSAPMVRAILDGRKTQTRRIVRPGTRDDWNSCPYGVIGDRLWVKETWGVLFECYERDADEPTFWKIDYSDEELASQVLPRWRSPRFMPRSRSRITLEIVNVRVERLQAISAKDILAEGAVDRPHVDEFGRNPVSAFDGKVYLDLISLWAAGWNAINGKRAPWKLNPWVWVIEFKVLP